MPHDAPYHEHAPSAGPTAGHGHNHDHASHLHSHILEADTAEDLQILTAQFIDGFSTAKAKAAFLKIAGVPLEIDDPAGGATLKLVDVTLTTEWQVGTASPSFGSRELSYLPYPGDMVTERTNLGFVYVSLDSKITRDLRAFLHGRP